ncbi:uncharacterized protein METZ01_LOCUS295063, partial [marine metagenome]
MRTCPAQHFFALIEIQLILGIIPFKPHEISMFMTQCDIVFIGLTDEPENLFLYYFPFESEGVKRPHSPIIQ